MNITWKYKIDLTNTDVFGEIEKDRNITIPEELKNLIEEANGATPSAYKFMVGSTEKTIGAILSFNKDDEDVDLVFTALSVIDDDNLIPFGIDAFGNYICLNLADSEVVYWSHENGESYSTGKSLNAFLDSLY